MNGVPWGLGIFGFLGRVVLSHPSEGSLSRRLILHDRGAEWRGAVYSAGNRFPALEALGFGIFGFLAQSSGIAWLRRILTAGPKTVGELKPLWMRATGLLPLEGGLPGQACNIAISVPEATLLSL